MISIILKRGNADVVSKLLLSYSNLNITKIIKILKMKYSNKTKASFSYKIDLDEMSFIKSMIEGK